MQSALQGFCAHSPIHTRATKPGAGLTIGSNLVGLAQAEICFISSTVTIQPEVITAYSFR